MVWPIVLGILRVLPLVITAGLVIYEVVSTFTQPSQPSAQPAPQPAPAPVIDVSQIVSLLQSILPLFLIMMLFNVFTGLLK